MIRKLTMWASTVCALATACVAVMSYACESQLECLDLDNLTPQRFGGDFDEFDNIGTDVRFKYRPEYFIVKDAALAYWCDAPRIGNESPNILGLQLLSHDFGGGSRGYVQASKGSFVLVYFELRARITPMIESVKDNVVFSVGQHWTGLHGMGCGTYLLSISVEERNSLSEDTTTVRFLRIPLWVVFLAFAGYPVLSLIAGPLRRRRRRSRNQCVGCGYNLTGLTEQRCPECGRTT